MRWSSGMSRLLGILILRYNQLVWHSFCILLFSAGQHCVYLWNYKSDSYGVFSKTKFSKCFQKCIAKLKFYSVRHKTHFAWSHHILPKLWVCFSQNLHFFCDMSVCKISDELYKSNTYYVNRNSNSVDICLKHTNNLKPVTCRYWLSTHDSARYHK